MENGHFKSFPATWTAILKDKGLGGHKAGQFFIQCRRQILVDAAYDFGTNGQAVSNRSLSLWLSAVKPVTALAIGILKDRDQLHWDQEVRDWIPEFGCKGKEPVTLRHLLTHTCGFRTAEPVPFDRNWEEIIHTISGAEIEDGWVIGKTAGYHMGASWHLLAEIIARITGSTYQSWLRDNIFKSLDMEDSYLGLPRTEIEMLRPRLMPSFEMRNGREHLFSDYHDEAGLVACRPGSNGRGPMSDLAKVYGMLLEGGQWKGLRHLKRTTVGEMITRQREGEFDRTFRHVIDWGLGLIINSNRYGKETVPYGYGEHASEDSFGHGGSQSCCAFADPKHQLIVCWVLNGMPGEIAHQKRVRRINGAIYRDLGLAT